jgi:hypothetical protein
VILLGREGARKLVGVVGTPLRQWNMGQGAFKFFNQPLKGTSEQFWISHSQELLKQGTPIYHFMKKMTQIYRENFWHDPR